MGRIIKFRRRRWTKARAYGPPKPLRFWPKDRHTVTARGLARDTWRWLRVLRPVILLGILLSIWPAADPALLEPPRFLQADPEPVSEQFSRCGPGRGHACVIDGDTFKLGERKIRIIGIDAPETHPPHCAEETRLGELATAELQRLLNERPFEMVGRIDDMKDRYGRDPARGAAADAGRELSVDRRRDARARAGAAVLGWVQVGVVLRPQAKPTPMLNLFKTTRSKVLR